MTTFDRVVEFVLNHEGGYSNDPDDPGGETNFGISKRSYPMLNIKALTRADAIEIYRKDYWMHCKCDQMPISIAVLLFDSAVNQGPGTAIRLLQRSLGVKTDGIVGPITIAASLKADTQHVVIELTARRSMQYATNAKLVRFGLGWFRRLAECHQMAIEEHYQ